MDLVGVGELDLAVDAPRADQRVVQNVQPVCRHQHLRVEGGLRVEG